MLEWNHRVAPAWPKPRRPPGRGMSMNPAFQPGAPSAGRYIGVRNRALVLGEKIVLPSIVPPFSSRVM
ncbi:hypothetical protein D3C87_1866580 [compost metagenome]